MSKDYLTLIEKLKNYEDFDIEFDLEDIDTTDYSFEYKNKKVR